MSLTRIIESVPKTFMSIQILVICTLIFIFFIAKDCQQRRPGASFVKIKETKPEVLDHEYQAFLSDMGIKYGGKKVPEEKKPYVPPMQGSSDASKGMKPTQRPLMLTNGSDAPGAASAHARAASKGEEYQSSAMRVS